MVECLDDSSLSAVFKTLQQLVQFDLSTRFFLIRGIPTLLLNLTGYTCQMFIRILTTLTTMVASTRQHI
jgi:hypothetical protein